MNISISNALAILYCLLTPLLVIPVFGLLGASDLLLLPTIFVCLIANPRCKLGVPELLLLAFLSLTIASTLPNDDRTYLTKAVRLVGIVSPFFLASQLRIEKSILARVFIGTGMISILIGVILWWLDLTLFEDEANQRIWLEDGTSRVRASGLFGNSGAFGSLIAAWTIVCVCELLTHSKSLLIYLPIVLFVSALGLLTSSSRASLLAVSGGLLTIASIFGLRGLILRKKGISKNQVAGFIAFCLAVTVGGLSSVFALGLDYVLVALERFNPFTSVDANTFLSGRVDIWEEYLKSFDKWFLLGVGYKQSELHFSMSPHNQFLAIAAECGIPALFLFLAILFSLGARLFSPIDRILKENLVSTPLLVSFVFDGMGGEPIGSWQITPIIFLFFGLELSSGREPTIRTKVKYEIDE